MKRMFAAGLFALPLFLAGGSSAQAQCAGGGCGGGPGGGLPGFFFGTKSFAACGGACSYFFPHMHQHGPLVNYGPYSGYYPFEPYGPWTSDLRYNYTPPCKHCGGKLGGGGCGSCGGGRGWGDYAKDTFRNVFHRCHPTAHKCGQSFGGCGTPGGCGSGHAAATAEPQPNPVLQTSYPRRER